MFCIVWWPGLVWWVVSCLRRGYFRKCLPSLCSHVGHLFIPNGVISLTLMDKNDKSPFHLSKCFLLKWVFHGSNSTHICVCDFSFLRCSFEQAMFWELNKFNNYMYKLSFVYYIHRKRKKKRVLDFIFMPTSRESNAFKFVDYFFFSFCLWIHFIFTCRMHQAFKSSTPCTSFLPQKFDINLNKNHLWRIFFVEKIRA